MTDPTTPGAGVPSARTLVIIPTYDERDNLPGVVERLLASSPDVAVLIADDNSPDGTGEVADRLAEDDARGRINVLHREGKQGLGAAYIAGFRWGLERGYTVLVEMDADGSHPPERLPAMLAAVDAGADLAIGSRYVPGGGVVNWPWRRHVISRGGNVYSRIMLGVGIKDITAGYRAYRSESLARLDLDAIESKGYCFQIDMTWRLLNNGGTVVEVPITFTERTVGQSKMSESIFREAAVNVARWGWEKRRRQLASLVRR
ncbi:polyprenol monophosphomannose synthase [Dietzia psychralcaliphila]|uniref:dolichyl-phosphate beta-D-mannosyltransferase n=1 Tax=Dietzia psychralcaliphila TaxID=139021 RepID=A0AAD0JQT3_9ACTN|nr:polyprenol monophosphomannose synthase [Dietzia psychralcaliphila]AWH95454.1 dolichol-phosphate mannosyltransferase [Dietzia psychralcaliphila]PTM88813.1 dolichol-phosphate mannosyltransferase [Dietzia psychralcaliphila]